MAALKRAELRIWKLRRWHFAIHQTNVLPLGSSRFVQDQSGHLSLRHVSFVAGRRWNLNSFSYSFSIFSREKSMHKKAMNYKICFLDADFSGLVEQVCFSMRVAIHSGLWGSQLWTTFHPLSKFPAWQLWSLSRKRQGEIGWFIDHAAFFTSSGQFFDKKHLRLGFIRTGSIRPNRPVLPPR